MIAGAFIGSLVGAFTGGWGIGLIFGGLIGLVLFPGIGVPASKPAEESGSGEQKGRP
jgi:hypothetical protein